MEEVHGFDSCPNALKYIKLSLNIEVTKSLHSKFELKSSTL